MKSETYNMDCMEYMRGLPDNAFDLAIVDPPYGIGAGKGTEIYFKKTDKWNPHGRDRNEHTLYGDWDKKKPGKDYFDELFRVSKNQIIWGGNYFTENLPEKSSWIVWDKMNGESFFADGELAWCSIGGKLRIFRYLSCGFLGSHKDRDVRIHPTQKPVALYKWLLAHYAHAGDRILDTHLGSGSSRIAAYDMGFDFVGIELDKDYFEAEEKRYSDHVSQLDLIKPEQIQQLQFAVNK